MHIIMPLYFCYMYIMNPMHMDACVIRWAAFHTHGAAGPSGVDTFAWQHSCSSFGDVSVGLCS